eukprot:TRINITY_DN17265_c0_g1_i1.p1 TRINITY_DN17265_c0_g1~~TRINITY_DN17265_c0_g1_i1.p1  ORF type:complete len:169 (+),score=19.56 TRINITY_DN17265_c0_g1_i1:88-594(+)
MFFNTILIICIGSTCIPSRSKTRPSTLKVHSEALDADRDAPLFCSATVQDGFADDDLPRDSEGAVATWQLGCTGCNGVTGTRSQGGARAGWSVGSAGHSAGRCMEPCPYVRRGEECFEGQSCMRCHMNHSEEDMSIKLALALVLRRKRTVVPARRACDLAERMSKLSL